MNQLIFYGVFGISAYIIQFVLGLKQIGYFTKTFKRLRQQGRVVIGRNPKRLRAGTIIMLAINEDNIIIAASKMQGLSIFAKFKD